MTAQDALKTLLLKLAEVQVQRAMMGMFSGAAPTSFLGKLGGLLGYADGGFTGQGGKYEPAGIVHKGEFVMSKAATERIGVGNLDRLHQSALRGYSGGGLVSDAPRRMVEALRPAGSDTQLAYRDDGYEHDPTYRVKGYEARTRELLSDEAKRWPALDAIANVPNQTRRAAWLALLFTGFRMSNIRALRWSDIDFDEGMLTLERMKNGLKRTFPLSDAALEVFRLTPRTHDQIVFEGRHYNKPITDLRQIDLGGNDVDSGGVLRPHDTRHLFSSAAAKAGLSGPVINWMRGDVTIMQGAAGRYMHDLGSHADANAIANQIMAKCGPSLPIAELLNRA